MPSVPAAIMSTRTTSSPQALPKMTMPTTEGNDNYGDDPVTCANKALQDKDDDDEDDNDDDEDDDEDGDDEAEIVATTKREREEKQRNKDDREGNNSAVAAAKNHGETENESSPAASQSKIGTIHDSHHDRRMAVNTHERRNHIIDDQVHYHHYHHHHHHHHHFPKPHDAKKDRLPQESSLSPEASLGEKTTIATTDELSAATLTKGTASTMAATPERTASNVADADAGDPATTTAAAVAHSEPSARLPEALAHQSPLLPSSPCRGAASSEVRVDQNVLLSFLFLWFPGVLDNGRREGTQIGRNALESKDTTILIALKNFALSCCLLYRKTVLLRWII